MGSKRAEEQRGNAKKKPQRVRVTNKALESRQFSTVRLPRTSEVPAQKADVKGMYRELEGERSGGTPAASAVKVARAVSATCSPSFSSHFDPIVNDPMFMIVINSKHWPPPSLEELHARTGHDHGDGFDLYDRREDDREARRERARAVRGEIRHPRGKPRRNTIVRLSDSSSSSSDADDGEHGSTHADEVRAVPCSREEER